MRPCIWNSLSGRRPGSLAAHFRATPVGQREPRTFRQRSSTLARDELPTDRATACATTALFAGKSSYHPLSRCSRSSGRRRLRARRLELVELLRRLEGASPVEERQHEPETTLEKLRDTLDAEDAAQLDDGDLALVGVVLEAWAVEVDGEVPGDVEELVPRSPPAWASERSRALGVSRTKYDSKQRKRDRNSAASRRGRRRRRSRASSARRAGGRGRDLRAREVPADRPRYAEETAVDRPRYVHGARDAADDDFVLGEVEVLVDIERLEADVELDRAGAVAVGVRPIPTFRCRGASLACAA